VTESRIRWTELEWYEVAREMIPMIEEGTFYQEAALAAQRRTLPKARRRPERSFMGDCRTKLRDCMARIKAGWVAEGGTPYDAPNAAPQPAPAPDAPTPTPDARPRDWRARQDAALEATFGTSRVYWTHREWAMMACAVKARIDGGDSRSLSRVFFETQVDVLPLDRCRRLSSLRDLGQLQAGYDVALAHVWELPKDLQAKLEGRSKEYEAHLAATREGLATVQAAAPVAASAPASDPIPEAVPEPAPSMTAAPLPQLAPGSDPLAAKISMIVLDAVTNAGSRIAAETRAHVMAEYDRQLDRLTLALASTMREYVHGLVSAELGGLHVTPPPLAPVPPVPPVPAAASGTNEPPTDAPTPGSEPIARGPRVDIVGFPDNLQRALEAARALNIEATVIHPDIARSMRWTPKGRDVIFMTRQASHTALERANKYAGNVMFATGGPSSLITMLESIAEHPGALQ
jgi:hypothetical protein